jgi:malate/lactate dehydrogenase
LDQAGVGLGDRGLDVLVDRGDPLLQVSASVGGIPVLDLLGKGGESVEELQREIEKDIRYANITIIEGTGASQYGIGAVSARLAEAVLRDERAVLPVAAYSPRYEGPCRWSACSAPAESSSSTSPP